MQTTGARAGELLILPPFDNRNVHTRQHQLSRQHQPCRSPTSNHHSMRNRCHVSVHCITPNLAASGFEVGDAESPLNESDTQNFATLVLAAHSGRLAAMQAHDTVDDKQVTLLVAVNYVDEDGNPSDEASAANMGFVPFAVLLDTEDSNPFERFEPPEDDGKPHALVADLKSFSGLLDGDPAPGVAKGKDGLGGYL